MTRSSSEGNASYSFDQPNRLLSHVSRVDGTRWDFSYDARGNLLEKLQTDTTGATGGPAYQRAGYDTICSNPVTCNKPIWIQDANGNTTHFVFDPVHGGLIKETLPPDKHGVRPEKRYSYTQRFAWLKDAGGGHVRAVRPMWLLSEISTCISGPATSSGVGCALGPSDEVRTVFDYGPDSGPSNLLLRGQSVIADGQTLLTCFLYDDRGNRISETTPNAALGSCP
jgi:YD repeat-containing protein